MGRYLVTGGCGFIGSHLVDALASRGESVLILDDLSTGKRERVPRGVELIVGDVADIDCVRAATSAMDGCFHLAAIASVARSTAEWATASRVNLGGLVNILDAARGRGAAAAIPVVYASSAAVYGSNAELPLTEASITRPLSAYGVDKLAGELHARTGAALQNVSSVGLRFFNVYGLRQDPASPYSGVIAAFAHRLASSEALTIYGDGGQSRDFVHVADVVTSLLSSLAYLQARNGGAAIAKTFNICSGSATTINELAEIVMDAYGRRVPIDHREAREGDVYASCGDPRAAATELQFVARMPLTKGISQLVRQLDSGSLAKDRKG